MLASSDGEDKESGTEVCASLCRIENRLVSIFRAVRRAFFRYTCELCKKSTQFVYYCEPHVELSVACALFVCACMGGLLPTTRVLLKSLQAKPVTEGSHGYTPRVFGALWSQVHGFILILFVFFCKGQRDPAGHYHCVLTEIVD